MEVRNTLMSKLRAIDVRITQLLHSWVKPPVAHTIARPFQPRRFDRREFQEYSLG